MSMSRARDVMAPHIREVRKETDVDAGREGRNVAQKRLVKSPLSGSFVRHPG